jgi:quinol-cytochrome oxidoreductase complex cytochrome b subunit
VPDKSHQASDYTKSKISAEVLLKREILLAAVTLSAVFLLSAMLDAPLNAPISSEGLTPENVKAPWIFLGVQQLLKRLPPMFAGVFIPALFLAWALALPFLPERAQSLGGSFFLALLAGYAALTIWGICV